MKITIIQTEIETAIRNYIGEMFTIREGMQIDIDLSATRGPEGFIANINVVPQNSGNQADQGGQDGGKGSTTTAATTTTTTASAAEPRTGPKTEAPVVSTRRPATAARAVPKADPVVAESPAP